MNDAPEEIVTDARVVAAIARYNLKRAWIGLLYLVILILAVSGASWFTHHADQQDLARVVRANESKLCSTSQSRWIVQHDVITTVTQAIALPPNTPANAYNYLRTVSRNNQLAGQQTKLLTELGPEPPLC